MFSYIDKIEPWMKIRNMFDDKIWQPNILIDKQSKFLIIPILKNHIEKCILENDFIKIKCEINDLEITYLCIIEKILIENATMLLKILKEEAWKNIRKSERVEVNYYCKICKDDLCINSYMTDISKLGCRIISCEQLTENTAYTINVFKEHDLKNSFLKVFGNIKRRTIKGNKLEYGIEFINTTDIEAELISMIINSFKQNESTMIKNLCKRYKD